MSHEHLNISEQAIDLLCAKYEIPKAQMHPSFLEYVYALDNYVVEEIPALPGKIDAFERDVAQILESQLSTENLRKLEVSQDLAENAQLLNEGVRRGVDNPILSDAKRLFKKHVTPILSETKQDILRAPVLAKLGSSLALPGKAMTGISTFWDELSKTRPFLRKLDRVIVKPMAISLYAAFLPEIGVIKACELVGRSMSAYAKAEKGQRWKAIKNAASEMLSSTLQHAERLGGAVLLIDRSERFSDPQKQVLKAIVNLPETANALKEFSKNPKISVAIMAGAAAVSSATGVDLKDTMQVVTSILTGNDKDGKKIDIKSLCRDEATKHMAPHLEKVFAVKGILPSSKNLKSVIGTIMDSKKIDDEIKSQLVETVTRHVVGQVVMKERGQASRSEAVGVIKSTRETKPKPPKGGFVAKLRAGQLDPSVRTTAL